jgi:ketosteroid isomerase-like protein
MTPKELIKQSVELFNQGKADEIALLYHEDAINYQIPNEAIVGKKAIKDMFKSEFANFKMTCITEHLFEDGESAILE